MLVLYNDPLYSVAMLEHTWGAVVFHDLMISSLFAALLIFWLNQTIKHAPPMAQVNRNSRDLRDRIKRLFAKPCLRSQYVIGFEFACLFWACFLLQMAHTATGPTQLTASYLDQHNKKRGISIMMILCSLTILLAYQAVLTLALSASIDELCKKPMADRFVYVVGITVFLALQLSLILGRFKNSHLAGAEVFLLGLTNLYIYGLVFFYWPIRRSLEGMSTAKTLQPPESERGHAVEHPGRTNDQHMQIELPESQRDKPNNEDLLDEEDVRV